MLTLAEQVLPPWSVTITVPDPHVPVTGTTLKFATLGPEYSRKLTRRFAEPGPRVTDGIPTSSLAVPLNVVPVTLPPQVGGIVSVTRVLPSWNMPRPWVDETSWPVVALRSRPKTDTTGWPADR